MLREHRPQGRAEGLGVDDLALLDQAAVEGRDRDLRDLAIAVGADLRGREAASLDVETDD